MGAGIRTDDEISDASPISIELSSISSTSDPDATLNLNKVE